MAEQGKISSKFVSSWFAEQAMSFLTMEHQVSERLLFLTTESAKGMRNPSRGR